MLPSLYWQQCRPMRCLCFTLFHGLHSLGINALGKVCMKNLVTEPKELFFSPPTLCPLHIPDTGFWTSWLMLLVLLLCCLLFSEGCCWKEDYIIMQIRLYNPEQTVQRGERRGNHTEWSLAGCGGTHSETTDWGGYGPPVKHESCSQTRKFFRIFLEFIVFTLNSASSVYLQSPSRTSRQTDTQENCKSACTRSSACGTMLQITTGKALWKTSRKDIWALQARQCNREEKLEGE